MKIGLEVTCLLSDRPTGIGNYTNNLVASYLELGVKPTLYYKISRYKKRSNFDIYSENVEGVEWHYKKIYNPFKKIDVAHSTDSSFLRIKKAKKIVTIHGLAVLNDITQNIPQYTTESFKKRFEEKLYLYNKYADGIITVSDQTRKDFLERFNYPEKRIKTIHLAGCNIDDEKAKDKSVLDLYNLKEKNYYLFVGSVSVRKNILNILTGFYKSKMHERYQLVLAGSESMGYSVIKDTIAKLGIEENVRVLGYIPDSHLPSLYSNSIGFVFPTYYEGFGIPIIEAMYYKIPVLVGNIGAAPEVAGNFGIKVSPFSSDEIADGLQKMPDIAPENLEQAYEYAKQFSWKKTAEKTLEFYQEICS